MKKSGSQSVESASRLIDARIQELADWRGETLSRLRALIKHLDNVSDADIADLNIPTGIPLVYELDENLRPIRHYYLGDAARVQEAIHAVANQASAKN